MSLSHSILQYDYRLVEQSQTLLDQSFSNLENNFNLLIEKIVYIFFPSVHFYVVLTEALFCKTYLTASYLKALAPLKQNVLIFFL